MRGQGSSVTCAILGRVPPPTNSQVSPAERSEARATFHLVSRAEWDAADPSTAYTPVAFERDGFAHCTDGGDEVAATANRYFGDLAGELLVLVLDRSRLGALIRYEDAAEIYPHVYGPIERAAVLQVLVMP